MRGRADETLSEINGRKVNNGIPSKAKKQLYDFKVEVI